MLPLDHLPFRNPDLTKLAAAFEALGFTVSPPGAYTSADVPDARWVNRCVFLKRGWFDLLAVATFLQRRHPRRARYVLGR